jgi:hypothetical protein
MGIGLTVGTGADDLLPGGDKIVQPRSASDASRIRKIPLTYDNMVYVNVVTSSHKIIIIV